MRLNCVIVNYRDADAVIALTRLLCSYECVREIVLVDNASGDDSVRRLRALEEERIMLLCAEENGGYGAGNNLGVRYAVEHNKATHVLIANPDILVSEACLGRLLALFARFPQVGVATALIQDRQYPDLKNGWRLRGFWGELLAMGPVSRRLFGRLLTVYEKRWKEKKVVTVDAVHGSMLMVDGEKFLACGGYDEHIFLYQEEAVLGQRMRAQGWKTALLLSCSYQHEHSVSIKKSIRGELERQRIREQSLLYYMKTYLGIGAFRELAARLWFFVIRMEIRAAGLIRRD